MTALHGVLDLFGRVFLSLIFFMSAVGNKIPRFNGVADFMGTVGVPAPKVMLAGAIVFLIAGSLSLIVGFKARLGALLLLVFLALATYYFHPFWTLEDPQAREAETINFMKNLALAGAMLIVIARGVGPLSWDARASRRTSSD